MEKKQPLFYFYEALDIIEDKLKENPLEVWKKD